MGVRSTHTILRTVAQQVLASSIIMMSDDELGDALEHLPESEYRNYDVVHSEEELKRSMFQIGTVEEFKYPRRDDNE